MILISPDDKSTLQQNGNMLLDDSGNKYYKKNGIYYLLPIKPIENSITVKYLDNQYFRDFKYSKSLTPTNKIDPNVYGIKESNVIGFIPNLMPNESALYLDHGCGSGSMRPMIESLGYIYIGADNEVGISTTVGGGEGFRNGATHYCDLHSLPFKDETFKFAHSYSVFEHLQNPFLAANELYRVMEKGGTCFIAIANLIPFHMDSFFHMTHFGVLNLFKSVGFNVLQVAGANWNAYDAISSMGGLPGPRLFRSFISRTIVSMHKGLWILKRIIKKNDDTMIDEITRHNMMSGIIKAIIKKPN